MIVHVSPDSPALFRDAATAVLVLHIGAASVGIVSGSAALAFRKGASLHRSAGNVFFVSMLTMSAIGAVVAPFLPIPQWSSTGAGLFTFYLVATGWATVRRGESRVGRFEVAAAAVALAVVTGFAVFAWVGAHSPGGMIEGGPYQPAVVFGAVAALAAACDLKVILRGGVSGAQRIARHIWRMCVALFIAALSFFLGQPKVFPPFLRGSPILFAPEIAILGFMVFWLVRVWLTGRSKPGATGPGTPAGLMDDHNQLRGNA
jgi:hypothetical protein